MTIMIHLFEKGCLLIENCYLSSDKLLLSSHFLSFNLRKEEVLCVCPVSAFEEGVLILFILEIVC